jgi:hypothetical protein
VHAKFKSGVLKKKITSNTRYGCEYNIKMNQKRLCKFVHWVHSTLDINQCLAAVNTVGNFLV